MHWITIFLKLLKSNLSDFLICLQVKKAKQSNQILKKKKKNHMYACKTPHSTLLLKAFIHWFYSELLNQSINKKIDKISK